MSFPRVTRRLRFDAAHRLTKNKGKCWNLHGHSYTAEFTVQALTLDTEDMVLDFGAIKWHVGRWIDTHWDHGLLLHEDDKGLLVLAENHGWKVQSFPEDPTVEVLVKYLFLLAKKLLEDIEVRVVHVRLYETPNCWADYVE